jgi:hypothetical protein
MVIIGKVVLIYLTSKKPTSSRSYLGIGDDSLVLLKTFPLK